MQILAVSLSGHEASSAHACGHPARPSSGQGRIRVHSAVRAVSSLRSIQPAAGTACRWVGLAVGYMAGIRRWLPSWRDACIRGVGGGQAVSQAGKAAGRAGQRTWQRTWQSGTGAYRGRGRIGELRGGWHLGLVRARGSTSLAAIPSLALQLLFFFLFFFLLWQPVVGVERHPGLHVLTFRAGWAIADHAIRWPSVAMVTRADRGATARRSHQL